MRRSLHSLPTRVRLSLMLAAVALGLSASSSFLLSSPPLPLSGQAIAASTPSRHARLLMSEAGASADAFDPDDFLLQIKEDIQHQQSRLAECEDEEECALEETAQLSNQVGSARSMPARMNAAKRHDELMSSLAAVQEEASEVRVSLQRLRDMRRSTRQPPPLP